MVPLVRSTLGPSDQPENRKDRPTEKSYCTNLIWDQKLCWKLTLEPKKTLHQMTGEAEPGVLHVTSVSDRVFGCPIVFRGQRTDIDFHLVVPLAKRKSLFMKSSFTERRVLPLRLCTWGTPQARCRDETSPLRLPLVVIHTRILFKKKRVTYTRCVS